MKKEMIYIAYGSNMNIEQMKRRCPKAIPIGKGILKDYKLVFKGVADVIKSPGDEVPIAIWKITEECEKALDRYEGFPHLYRKEYVTVEIEGKEETGMVYVMNRGNIAPPNCYYYNVIHEGYKDFKINKNALEKAYRESCKSIRNEA